LLSWSHLRAAFWFAASSRPFWNSLFAANGRLCVLRQRAGRVSGVLVLPQCLPLFRRSLVTLSLATPDGPARVTNAPPTRMASALPVARHAAAHRTHSTPLVTSSPVRVSFSLFSILVFCAQISFAARTLASLQAGACSCPSNVVGRTCDACAPNTYGLSSSGALCMCMHV
jgi:hypothetical protein